MAAWSLSLRWDARNNDCWRPPGRHTAMTSSPAAWRNDASWPLHCKTPAKFQGLPRGYDTEMADGKLLSGGQRPALVLPRSCPTSYGIKLDTANPCQMGLIVQHPVKCALWPLWHGYQVREALQTKAGQQFRGSLKFEIDQLPRTLHGEELQG